MGGDGGPDVVVPAALAVAGRYEITLVGDPARIEPLLPAAAPAIELVQADEVVTEQHSLSEVLRGLKRSSMRLALRRQAEGAADAVVSAGSTAALMALARLELGMTAGVSRPAIVKGLSGVSGEFWMLDVGANLDCSADILVEFARMGAQMARAAGGLSEPRVGLLNIGTEAGKGPDNLQLAATLLEREPDFRYLGFVEGQRLFLNDVDVIVCDGFAGNIALKSVEGAAAMAAHLLRESTQGAPRWRRGLARLLGFRRGLSGLFDAERYNGATLLGVNGVVVKSHGSAGETGYRWALEEAGRQVSGRMLSHLTEAFA